MIKAVIFDFIGTLAAVEGYSHEKSVEKMYQSLTDDGVNVNFESFVKVYEETHQKYSVIRYKELVEINTVVWLSETLNKLGFSYSPKDSVVKKAVDRFYENYLDALKARPHARTIIKRLSGDHTLGLVSNFTHAPVIHAGLKKLGLNQFFKAILVSAEVGWRKPNSKIFEEALKRLGVKANEAIFIGDNPIDDIQGAKSVGMKTVFVPSLFSSLDDAQKAQYKPDIIINELSQILKVKFP